MTTALLQPQKLPPANDGHVRGSLTADERLMRKAVARCFKAQVAEVHGKVEGGAKSNAVPEKTTKWDQEVMREVRPIWFGLFKKGGDKALKSVRRFPKHARKMAVLGEAEMENSVPVAVVQKGGPGSGNFGHEGRPGEVGGSGPGGGAAQGEVDSDGLHVYQTNIPAGESSIVVYHGTSEENAKKIRESGFLDGSKNDIYLSPNKDTSRQYGPVLIAVRVPRSKLEEVNFGQIKPIYGEGPLSDEDREMIKENAEYTYIGSKLILKSLKATPSIVIPEWIEDPDVLDALEAEMFEFAHNINQATADMLREELLDGMENGETISQLKNRISDISDEWVEGYRSERIARTETARAFSVGHIEAWKSTDVVGRKVWTTAGDCCPFCAELEGVAVGLDENFFKLGDEQTVEWRGKNLVMAHDYSDIKGPPLHPNCRCALIGELIDDREAAKDGGEKIVKEEKGGPGKKKLNPSKPPPPSSSQNLKVQTQEETNNE